MPHFENIELPYQAPKKSPKPESLPIPVEVTVTESVTVTQPIYSTIRAYTFKELLEGAREQIEERGNIFICHSMRDFVIEDHLKRPPTDEEWLQLHSEAEWVCRHAIRQVMAMIAPYSGYIGWLEKTTGEEVVNYRRARLEWIDKLLRGLK